MLSSSHGGRLDQFEFLNVSCAESIGTVVMRRPPVNAVSQAMYEEIRRLIHPARRTPPGRLPS